MTVFDKTQACNCLAGEPYIDGDGICRCTNVGGAPNQLQCGPDEYVRWLPNGDQVCVSMGRRSPLDPAQLPPVDAGGIPQTAAAQTAAAGTIFGLPGWAILAAAGIGLYFLAASDDKKPA
ncbi:MAG: hypothetical protein KF736_09910 [Acidobacteria bacterium]|nr:hypothetical protein [Acidobacteriota bacterium]MCW5949828.1 hypothetical protein [Pyrinomonadaceae bacterium]